jgi:DedD protein
MAESEDVNTLKRRGRRRLVGAIALVLAAVIVLPMVFDSEPKGSAPPVSVRIPGEEESGFAPKVAQKAPDKALEKAAEKAVEKGVEKTPEKAPEKAAEPVAEKAPEPVAEKPAAKIEIKVTKAVPASPAPAERAKAEAVVAGEPFVVQVGAFADPEKIKEVVGKLKGAKIPFYTEQIAVKSGMLTRVRAGPFAGRDAADQAQQKLRDLGLKPGNVATKS